MKVLYIIPGYTDTTRRRQYQSLAKLAEKKGYKVVKINPDWNKSLSKQVFDVEDNSIIFGFSLGGILGMLVWDKNKKSKLILASATTYLCSEDLRSVLVEDIVKDIAKTKNIRLKNYLCFYGEYEKDDIEKYVPKKMKITKFIPKTEHEISKEYLKEIAKHL